MKPQPQVPAVKAEQDANTNGRERPRSLSLDAIRQLYPWANSRTRGVTHYARRSPADASDTPIGDPDEQLSTRDRRFMAIFGTDIAGYGQRDQQTQDYVRDAMYTMLRQAFTDAGLPGPEWRDRGDGALLIVPHEDAHRMIDQFVPHLNAGLRRHNKRSSDDAKIVLRTAMHAGNVYRDANGLTGDAIVRMCRLLEAQSFKQAVAAAGAALGLVVSQHIYENVVHPGEGLIDPDTYSQILIENKETLTYAWLHLPSRAGAAL
jgi:hypothetical protein